MAWVGAMVHHPVLGGYSLDFPCDDYCIPVRLLAVALQERLARVIGVQKVTEKFPVKICITILRYEIM